MRRRSEETQARLLAAFQTEAEEHLGSINAALGSLRSDPGEASAADMLFRAVHTLKGASRSVGLLPVETICQALETLLRRVTLGELALSPRLVAGLQEAVDDVASLIEGQAPQRSVPDSVLALERLVGGAAEGAPGDMPVPGDRSPESASVQAAPPPDEHVRDASETVELPEPRLPVERESTIRVPAEQLDALLLQLEDLLLPKLAAGQRVRELQALADAVTSRRKQHGESSEWEALAAELPPIVRRLREDERRLTRLHEQLQAEVLRLRTSPVSGIVEAMPRMIRDLARETGKEVELTLTGTELELDRRVLERIKDPLIHLLRNAVDHGIESPEVREQAGKPREGRIRLSFGAAESRRIEVAVADDGAGIRPEVVREAAVRSRLIGADNARTLSAQDSLELLFQPGFSTSPVVTRVSGQGLGLPIVRERVEGVGGSLQVESDSGAGTTVRMLLPATIATVSGLLVRAGERQFLLPVQSVEHVLRITEADVTSLSGRTGIYRMGQFLPVSPLQTLLDLPGGATLGAGRLPCLVLVAGQERIGLLVDEVLGERELLAKELEPPLVRVRHVAGAGLLGTGELVLTLRAAELIRTSLASESAPLRSTPPAARSRAPVILVVDDSLTTRVMEKNLLESAGYTVKTAVDGMEAWTLLASESFDLLVSDVDMPRMDGFELTARIRADARLRELPVILVTAMESREHRERGVLAGANAYVIKSSFEESNLLEIITRLL
ncbi:MAG: response regulator [Armatimonadota bacterium]